MSWTTDIRDPSEFRREAERAMTLPLGLVSPFWVLFGAAATAGVTWWWLNKLARAADLDAARESAAVYEMAEATPTTIPIAVRTSRAKKSTAEVDAEALYAEATETFANPDAADYSRVVVAPETPAEASTETHEAEIPAETSEASGAAGHTIVVSGPEAEEVDDDFTRLNGIGPRIAAALIARGVTRFGQLAAWTADQLAAFDQEMNLRGRAIRSDWIEQAKRLSRH